MLRLCSTRLYAAGAAAPTPTATAAVATQSARATSVWSSPLPTLAHTTARSATVLTTPVDKPKRILVVGSLGQIGSELVNILRARHGVDNVIASDVMRPTEQQRTGGPFIYVDVLDYNQLASAVVSNNVSWIVHMASVLSAAGERNPQLALKVNVLGMHNVLEVGRKYQLRVFAPSTIAAFGPSSPKDNTPDVCIQDPTTMYGITKVHLELLGQYYNDRYGLDFRSLRYPGIISSETLPGGGTTDYAVEIYYEALKQNAYKCFLQKDATLPMMYMPDCLKATVDLLEAPRDKLSQCVYNVTAFSFAPVDVAAVLGRLRPGFTCTYEPDFRQAIAETWPRSIDDSIARRDWDWEHEYDLEAMSVDMLEKLKPRLGDCMDVPA